MPGEESSESMPGKDMLASASPRKPPYQPLAMYSS